MKQRFFILFLVFIASMQMVKAQDFVPSIHLEATDDRVMIGELISMKIQVKSLAADTVDWQLATAAFDKVIVLQANEKQTFSGKVKTTVKEFVFTSSDSGYKIIGSFPILIFRGRKTFRLNSQPLNFHFSPEKPILRLHDLKTQAPAKITFWFQPLFMLPAIAFSLALLALVGFRTFRKSQLNATSAEDAHGLQMLKALEKRLENNKLPNSEVTAELAAILQTAHLQQFGKLATGKAKTLGQITEKLDRLQFGPEAGNAFQEEILLLEIQKLLELAPDEMEAGL